MTREETQHWSVSVSRDGVNLVTIESNMLAGQPEDARVIRGCAAHLLAFIGPEPAVEDEMDAAKHLRDSQPRYSQYQLDEATKPLHAEIERLRAALSSAPHDCTFEPTGNHAIDRVLSAVACAGKAYHNTADWTDGTDWQGNPNAPHPEFGGASPCEWIQRAANDAAIALSQPARTCGSCKHDKCCGIQAVCVSSVFLDKRVTGCISAWTPREPETP